MNQIKNQINHKENKMSIVVSGIEIGHGKILSCIIIEGYSNMCDFIDDENNCDKYSLIHREFDNRCEYFYLLDKRNMPIWDRRGRSGY